LQPVFVVCPVEMHGRGRFFGTEEVADGFEAVIKSFARLEEVAQDGHDVE